MLLQLYHMGQRVVYCISNQFWSKTRIGLVTVFVSDDILLISPSVTNVERLLHRCEHELAWLDMSINLKKKYPVYESALVVMQRVLSLLVLQVAVYHGWRKFGTSGCTLSKAKRGFFSCHYFWKDWKGSL